MKTVVGLVAGYREADILVQELTARGFKREEVEIIRLQTVADQKGIPQECVQSIEEFFGPDEAPQVRGYYSRGEGAEGVIVSVFVEDEEADRAATAMIHHGGVRIYNHSTEKPMLEEFLFSGKESGSEKRDS